MEKWLIFGFVLKKKKTFKCFNDMKKLKLFAMISCISHWKSTKAKKPTFLFMLIDKLTFLKFRKSIIGLQTKNVQNGNFSTSLEGGSNSQLIQNYRFWFSFHHNKKSRSVFLKRYEYLKFSLNLVQVLHF